MSCDYCEPAGTRLLTEDTKWVPIERIRIGDRLVGFGRAKGEARTRFRSATVTGVAERQARVFRITTDKGVVKATGDHRWLMQPHRWRRTDRIRAGQRIRWVSTPIDPPESESPDYMLGYVVGAGLGDGTLGHYTYDYCTVHSFRLAVMDAEIADRFSEYLTALGIAHTRRPSKSTGSAVHGVFVTGKHKTALIEEALSAWKDTEQFHRGFLAGIFDAEGSYDGQSIRIHNTNNMLIDRTVTAIATIGVDFTVEKPRKNGVKTVAITNTAEVIRFLAATDPACRRKTTRVFDRMMYGAATVLSVEPEDTATVYSVETTTGNYISEGFASHNCFLHKTGQHRVMTPETLRDAIAFLENLTDQPGLHCFGTEPTMQWGLIQEARRLCDWPISLTTNGLLLTPERIDWMADNDVKVFVYSIDGGPEHNGHRVDAQGRPTWDTVSEHLRYLVQFQGDWVTARATWTPDDYDLLGRFEALEALGVRSIQVVPDIEVGVEWDEQRVEQAYLELGEHYAWRRTPSRYINDLVDAIAQGKPKPGNPCNFGRGCWAVMPDGELRACQRGERIGSIYEGITDAAPLYESALCGQIVNSRAPLKAECSDCVAFGRCPGVGYCSAANRAAGNPAIPTEAHCQHLRGMVRACQVWAERRPAPTGRVIQDSVLGVVYGAAEKSA